MADTTDSASHPKPHPVNEPGEVWYDWRQGTLSEIVVSYPMKNHRVIAVHPAEGNIADVILEACRQYGHLPLPELKGIAKEVRQTMRLRAQAPPTQSAPALEVQTGPAIVAVPDTVVSQMQDALALDVIVVSEIVASPMQAAPASESRDVLDPVASPCDVWLADEDSYDDCWLLDRDLSLYLVHHGNHTHNLFPLHFLRS